MIRKLLLIMMPLLLVGSATFAQTSLQGKVTDEKDGSGIIQANIVLKKGGKTVGTATDFDGNYSIGLDPGTYEVEVTYIGYSKSVTNGVVVKAGQANALNVRLSDNAKLLGEVIITEYKKPLIELDKTTGGQTLTSEEIRNLPTRDINGIAATTAGLSAIDGGDVTIKGSRSDATAYILDGVRVRGALPPSLDIEQLQVITGGIEAQYGDVTGGIISITSKGPASKFSGAFEAETSKYLDPYGQTLLNLSMSAPILKNKKGESILGFRFTGQYNQKDDDNPRAFGVYKVKDAKIAEIEANPTRLLGATNVSAAEFIRKEDIELLKAAPNEGNRRLDLTGKLDFRINEAIDMTLSGNYSNTKDQFSPNKSLFSSGDWTMLNSARNPFDYDNRFRVNLRFRHRLSGNAATSTADAAEAKAKKGALIRNAYYTLQASYEKGYARREDQIHQDRLFDYGYVGKFDYQWTPVYGVSDWSQDPSLPNNPTVRFGNVGYRRDFTGYTPGTQNPIRTAYNKNIDTGNDNVFLARNSFFSQDVDKVWGLRNFRNTGDVYNRFSKNENNTYTFNATTGFDLLLGGSEKGRHSIQLGLIYEQRDDRDYVVSPEGLWQLARLSANRHITGIDTNSIAGYDSIPLGGPGSGGPKIRVARHGNLVTNDADLYFYKEVRNLTGQKIDEYVNTDGLSPDQLKLSMFAPKELMDQQLISYYGYDYLGNRTKGNVQFNDFFTGVDAEGRRTFLVAPNRPIYQALYVQDKFTFKDIIFRVGLRADVFDANTKVMKDPYSLYAIQGAKDFFGKFGGNRPSTIGDDYKVYVDADNSKTPKAYRNGDQWYFANGTAANDGNVIFGGEVVYPKLVNKDDKIQLRGFDPNSSFQDYKPQVNLLPRLAFSFPISDDANFFAHYDILAQRPPANSFATAADYFYLYEPGRNTEDAPLQNPDLKPERTIDYEVGFQQKISNSSAIKLSAYYKEMRDMIQRRTYLYVPVLSQYYTYGNIDFGTVKGFTLQYDLRRTGNLTLNIAYTLQFADATGSDANSQKGLNSRGNLRTLFPLSFDERHRISAVIDYRYGSGKQYTGPRVGGVNILEEFGLNIQLTSVSGRPYTAKQLPRQFSGEGTVGSINGSRLPWTFGVDMRIDKTVSISKDLDVNLFVRVQNLFDTRNVKGAYPVTGSATDDGYLVSNFGVDQVSQIRSSGRDYQSFIQSYQRALLDPSNFTLPRRIYAGLTFNF